MKLGIFIGSFNPIHLGHKRMVISLLEEKVLDKIIIVPSNDEYYLKDNLVAFSDRYNMIKLCLEDENIIISDIEKDGYNYTCENISIIKEKYPKDSLYLIIGADNLIEIEKWKNYKSILNNCNLIVFKRNNIELNNYIKKHFTNYENKIIIKEQIGNISSTLIRNLLKNNDESLKKYLDSKVFEYINKNHLYRG